VKVGPWMLAFYRKLHEKTRRRELAKLRRQVDSA